MEKENAQSYIQLHGGGFSSLSLDVSYFPQLPVKGSTQNEEFVEEFKKFILPSHLASLKPSNEVEISLIVHSSVRLPGSFEGVTFQCKRNLNVISFEGNSGVCEKYEGEGHHYHYLCKVLMGSMTSSASGTSLSACVKPVSGEVEVELPQRPPDYADICREDQQQNTVLMLQERIAVLEKNNQFIESLLNSDKMVARNEFGMQKRAELILPEDVWSKILDMVQDPQDRYNCYKTCKLFKRLLGVCPLLEMTFSSLFPYLDKPDILSMRKVNSKLKSSLDNQLKHHPSLRPTADDNPSRYHQNKAFLRRWHKFNDGNTFTINFGQIEVIQRHRCLNLQAEDKIDQKTASSFCNRWRSLMKLKGGPLLTGYLTITIPWYINVAHTCLEHMGGEDGFRECGFRWEKIFDMIRELGRYVLYLTINCSTNGWCNLDAYRMYQLVLICLTNAPNLRSLTLIMGEPDFDWLGLLKDEMIRSPLPNHLHLETIINISTSDHNKSTTIIADTLMTKYSGQLGKVKWADLSGFDRFEFPKMTELRANVKYLDILKLAQAKIPNLRTLSFLFDPKHDFTSNQFFDVLNNFPKLTVLKVDIYVYSARTLLQDINSLPKQACATSKIQILHFKHRGNISYNFLIRLPNLRVLHIRGPKNLGVVDIASENTDLHKVLEGDLSLMSTSNVWETIPSLEQITYHHDSTRQAWSRPAHLYRVPKANSQNSFKQAIFGLKKWRPFGKRQAK